MDLWNRAQPDAGAVRPLNVHEFDALVMGKIGFDHRGLIVAESDGRVVGYAHAGFGPREPQGPSLDLDTQMGTIAMLLLEPGWDDPDLERGLFREAEGYLKRRGATVVYAGGQYPVNPFYWGLYGGSEFAGVLGRHTAFLRAAERSGYEAVATTVLLESDLSRPETRDPRAPLLRRQVRLEVSEDALPSGWWEALAIGLFRPTSFQLLDRSDDRLIAHATTWDIPAYGDGQSRCGLVNMEVESSRRRQGFGRLLVTEILRHARGQMTDIVAAQTSSTNAPALNLYRSMGFAEVETATLFRLPGDRS